MDHQSNNMVSMDHQGNNMVSMDHHSNNNMVSMDHLSNNMVCMDHQFSTINSILNTEPTTETEWHLHIKMLHWH